MGFQIVISYGDFSLAHQDDEDSMAAMQSGTYSMAFRYCVSQMSNLIEAGILDDSERDLDAEAAAMIAATADEEEAAEDE